MAKLSMGRLRICQTPKPIKCQNAKDGGQRRPRVEQGSGQLHIVNNRKPAGDRVENLAQDKRGRCAARVSSRSQGVNRRLL